MDWTAFTPWSSLAGGVLIGLGAALLLVSEGRIAGISGITAGLLTERTRAELVWRGCFLGALLAAGFLLSRVRPEAFANSLDRSYVVIAIAGLLVGVGTRLGSGCTSGHGVCGVARLSPRSLIATFTFVLVGMLTVVAFTRLVGS